MLKGCRVSWSVKGLSKTSKRAQSECCTQCFKGLGGINATHTHVAGYRRKGFWNLKHCQYQCQTRFLKPTLKKSQNVFFVQRTNHKLGNAISMYLPHDPIFKQWGKMCDLQTLSRCDWVCYMIWFQNLFRGELLLEIFIFSTYNHDLMFSWPILYSEQIQKNCSWKISCPWFSQIISS